MPRMCSCAAILLLPVIFVGGVWKPADTAAAAGPEKAGVSQIAWLAGRWQADRRSAGIVESWEKPKGEAMIGMAQLSDDPDRPVYEFMVIAREGDDLVMRIRHFGAKLTPREQEAMAYKMIECTKTRAVFERPEDPRFQKLIYELSNAGELSVRLQGRKNGKVMKLEFQLKRSAIN